MKIISAAAADDDGNIGKVIRLFSSYSLVLENASQSHECSTCLPPHARTFCNLARKPFTFLLRAIIVYGDLTACDIFQLARGRCTSLQMNCLHYTEELYPS